MQIFHWIFKAAAQDEPSCGDDLCDEQVKQQDIFLFRNRSRSQSRSDKDTKTSPRKSDFKTVFAILCRKDVAKACFYNTINLKQPATFNRWDVPRRRASGTTMKKEDIIARGLGMVSHRRSADSLPSSSHHVGNKVQPLTEAAATSSITGETPCMAEIKENVKGEKVKAMSRMKELLRWAAATRADKGGGKFLARKVLMFRNKPALKAVPDEDHQLSIDSPKISFQWDVESCSTTTSSAFSCISSRTDRFMSSESPSRKANWITTDSDFVVLEL